MGEQWLAIPNWLLPHVAGPTSANGYFLLTTALGAVRVHGGDVVVEHQGELWCRPTPEIPALMKVLTAEAAPALMAIGPENRRSSARKHSREPQDTRGRAHNVAFGKPPASMPSIEWVHVTDLAVDHSYQRSIDNCASRRLIASIAANFDWRPLCTSGRFPPIRWHQGHHRRTAPLGRGRAPGRSAATALLPLRL